jgi:hypothetical protein
MWRTPQDGIVICKSMTDMEVYVRCRVFGADRMIEALEEFLKHLEIVLDTK